MTALRSSQAVAFGVMVSVGLHAFAAAGLSRLPAPQRGAPSPVVQVSIEIPSPAPNASPAPEPPVPEKESLSKDEQVSVPGRLPAVAPPAPRAGPEPAAEPVAEPAEPGQAMPVDLTGTTLTASEGAWTAPRGNGRASAGPIRTPRRGGPLVARRPTPNPRSVRPEARTADVAADSLSRPPRPPKLDALLESNYPAFARSRGIGGEALVRVRIRPDGRVGAVTVISESQAGFGSACRATVQGSRWSPPLDASGRKVGTTVHYRCRFRVDP